MYEESLFKLLKKLFLLHIYTSTLDPSLNGLITTGKFNLDSIFLIKFDFVANLSKLNLKYLGFKILFFINIFFDISLSIAKDDDRTPE